MWRGCPRHVAWNGVEGVGAFVGGAVQVDAPQVQFVRGRLPWPAGDAYRASVDGCVPARPWFDQRRWKT